MKNLTNCLFFAFGVASTIFAALLYSKFICNQTGAVDNIAKGIKNTIDEAVETIDTGTEMVKGALNKAKI
jgi:hypothetical protein